MADEDRQETNSLSESILDRLKDNPFRFDFFHAIRELESRFRRYPRVGRAISPREDPIRFGQNPDLTFPTSTLENLEPASEVRPPKLNIRFFGLLGPNGPLPIHYTEYAYERLRNFHDPTVSAFYNIFHHRLTALFYRAWAINQKSVDLDRPEEARFPFYLGSFFGMADSTQQRRDSLPDDAKLYFAGRLSAQARNSLGLQSILSTFFGVSVEVEPMVGAWLRIPENYWCRLGSDPGNASLGHNATIGERCWDVQSSFKVRLGPVGLKSLMNFLPGCRSCRRLIDWIAFYSGNQFNWEAKVILKREEIPPTNLGGGSLLGWTSWVCSEPAQTDSDDYTINASLGENTQQTK